MPSLISNTELTEQLEIFLPNCSQLNIISAFVTNPAIEWLDNLVSHSSVCIVGRFIPSDFIAGASDFKSLKKSIENGWEVRALSNLHAKIYQLDENLVFTGSANMTGKGLSLVEEGNLEACTRLPPSDISKKFIQKLICSSILLNIDMINKMEEFVGMFLSNDVNDIPDKWPEEIMLSILDVFVSDFPLATPGSTHKLYESNPSLEFAVVESKKHDFISAQQFFKNSKAYRWLKEILINHKDERDLGFGQISSLLHDELCDDPAPYRRDIKSIQANLYEYLELYASDEIEIYVPGRRSQVLRLI